MEYCSGGSCSDLVSTVIYIYLQSLAVHDQELTPPRHVSHQMKPGRFREDYIAIVVRELLRGLEYLHGEGKLHRDIKGERFQHSASTLLPLIVIMH